MSAYVLETTMGLGMIYGAAGMFVVMLAVILWRGRR